MAASRWGFGKRIRLQLECHFEKSALKCTFALLICIDGCVFRMPTSSRCNMSERNMFWKTSNLISKFTPKSKLVHLCYSGDVWRTFILENTKDVLKNVVLFGAWQPMVSVLLLGIKKFIRVLLLWDPAVQCIWTLIGSICSSGGWPWCHTQDV